MSLFNKRIQRYLALFVLIYIASSSLMPLYIFNNKENVKAVEVNKSMPSTTNTSTLVLSYSINNNFKELDMTKLQSSDIDKQSVANEDVMKQNNFQLKVQSTSESVTPEPTPETMVESKKFASNGKEYVYYEVYDNVYGSNKWHNLSEDLQEYTYELCIEYGIEEFFPLILSQLFYESQYDSKAISPTNDYGIAQINKGNHKWLSKELGVTDFLDPRQNILCNIYMMSGYLKKVSARKALIWYNAGNPNSTNRRSRHYSENIISLWNDYTRLKE